LLIDPYDIEGDQGVFHPEVMNSFTFEYK